MENSEIEQQRKEKIKNWFSSTHNLTLSGILIFAFAIRFYYYLMTKFQPLWWDEAVYGTLAKNIFLGNPWSDTFLIAHETIIRPPLFPLFWSLLLKLGIQESGVRFLLEFLPSVISVYLVYLIGKEFYNKRIGLIASFIFSVLWIHLFYTSRLLTNVIALPFLFASIYSFIRSTRNELKSTLFMISLFLLSISTLIRYPNGLVFLVYLISLFILYRQEILKKPNFWISGIAGVSPLLIFFIYNKSTQGSIFPALLGSDYISTGTQASLPIAWNLLNFIPVYLKTIFFIFFLIGMSISIFELFINYDLVRRKSGIKLHLINLLTLIIIYAYFVFYLRAAEDRYFFPITLALVAFSGVGFDFIYKRIKKYSKPFSIILVVLLLAIGANSQIKHADSIIKNKLPSFLQMKQGFEWMKSNTPQNSIILGAGTPPYITYYAERNYLEPPKNFSEYYQADYLVINAFSSQPPELTQFLQENQGNWTPINVIFFNNEKTQPAFVIYQKTIA